MTYVQRSKIHLKEGLKVRTKRMGGLLYKNTFPKASRTD